MNTDNTADGPPIFVDIETGDAHLMWNSGREFVRIAAYAEGGGQTLVTTDIPDLIRRIESARYVIGHNILGYDLPILARLYDLDLARLVRENRVIDTLIIARLNDPPLSGTTDLKRYGLQAVCHRLGIGDKVAGAYGESALKDLAARHGGYDRIPLDDPTYRKYVVQDVDLIRGLAKASRIDGYGWREHQVMWRLGHISSAGWVVDTDAAKRGVAARDRRIEQHKKALHTRYGLPLVGARPHTTTAGKEAVERAFASLGVDAPRTRTGAIATGKDALDALAAAHADNPELVELCTTLRALNGERTVAQMLLDHTGPDGRIHPDVEARQATGRISVTNPGLTVLGKRDRGNVLERAYLLPERGCELICADLSQIDAKAMAAHAQDPAYIHALRPGSDFHSEMAGVVFGADGWDRSAGHHPRRAEAKAITHATSYGMGARALANTAGISVDEAARHLATLDLRFPRLAAFKASVREAGRGQLVQTAYGRWVRIEPGREYTQAPAAVGQGTARDLMMEGILRLPEWMLPCLRAIIHDEIVLSVPSNRADEAEKALLAALQFEFVIRPDAMPVTITAELSRRGQDWADCYRDEKSGWPEVARTHRDQPSCDDDGCTWHTTTTEETAA